MTTIKRLMPLAGVLLSISNTSAAVTTGTDNQDGTWTIASTTIGLETAALPFGLGTEDRVTFDSNVRISIGESASPPLIAYRRDSDLSLGSTEVENTLPIYSDFINDFGANAQAGSNNFLLLSLEPGQSDWDTVVQFNFDDSLGLSGDSILGIWHDDSSSGENIIANISNFSELAALVVPEPSSTLLLGFSALVVVARRKRIT